MSGKKGGFANHESSSVHKKAVEVIEMLSRTMCDIGEQLSSTHTEEKLQNRVCVHIECISNHTIFNQTRPSIAG